MRPSMASTGHPWHACRVVDLRVGAKLAAWVANDAAPVCFEYSKSLGLTTLLAPDRARSLCSNTHMYCKAVYCKAVYGKAVYCKAVYCKAVYCKAEYCKAVYRSALSMRYMCAMYCHNCHSEMRSWQRLLPETGRSWHQQLTRCAALAVPQVPRSGCLRRCQAELPGQAAETDSGKQAVQDDVGSTGCGGSGGGGGGHSCGCGCGW